MLLTSAPDAEKLTDRKNEAKERFRETLLLWLSFWRDVLLHVSGTETSLTNVDRAGEIAALAGRLTLAETRRLVTDVEVGRSALARLAKNNRVIESREPGTPTPALLKGGEEKSPCDYILPCWSGMHLTASLR